MATGGTDLTGGTSSTGGESATGGVMATGWIANYGSNSVSVLNVDKGEVIDTITVGASPIAVAIHPTRQVLYVSNFGAGTVSVIDRATRTVLKTLTVGSGARGIAFAPNGTKAYVGNYYEQTFTVIETLTDSVTNTVSGLTYPVGATALPGGHSIYMTQHSGSTSLGVIDTSGDTVTVASSPVVGSNSMATRFNTAGTLGYVAAYSRAILLAAPASTDGTYWIDPDGSGPLAAQQVYCDMTTDGGGWTLVYHATNHIGTIENGTVTGPDAIGTSPFTLASIGQFKLSDAAINALRSGAVANDLRVTVRRPGFSTLFGTSFHPKECMLKTVPVGPDSPAASDVCNKSTKLGPNDTSSYVQSGHFGSLTRWYVDGDLGYIWPTQHIGPMPGGTYHGPGTLPPHYCTWVDSRTCPEDTAFEIWAY